MTTDNLQANSQLRGSSRGKALVVDSDREDLQSYAGVLRRLGFHVKTFTDFHRAALCLQGEPVDFVFVSQGSTAFEARSVVEQALARDRHTPVVVLAPHLDLGCYLEAIQLGAVDYLEKPLAPAELEHLVTTHGRPSGLKITQSA